MSKKSLSVDTNLVLAAYGEVRWKNGVLLGHILAKEDGFYDYWPKYLPGTYMPAHMLHALADMLDEMNEPWEKQIRKENAG